MVCQVIRIELVSPLNYTSIDVSLVAQNPLSQNLDTDPVSVRCWQHTKLIIWDRLVSLDGITLLYDTYHYV